MLEINFLPDSDLDDFSIAIKEYETIWDFALSFTTKEERQQKFKEMMAP